MRCRALDHLMAVSGRHELRVGSGWRAGDQGGDFGEVG